jgi:hypothetical protein
MPIRPEQFVTVYDDFARQAVEEFNRNGSVHPMLYGVAMSKTQDLQIAGVATMAPQMVLKMHDSAEGQEALMQFVDKMLDHESDLCRQMQRQGVPLAEVAVHVTETWVGYGYPKAEEANASPAQRSDQHEAVVVTVTSPERTEIGMCPIESEPQRRCVYQELKLSDDETVLVGQRVHAPRSGSGRGSKLH